VNKIANQDDDDGADAEEREHDEVRDHQQPLHQRQPAIQTGRRVG
jgi:hypothetical protein